MKYPIPRAGEEVYNIIWRNNHYAAQQLGRQNHHPVDGILNGELNPEHPGEFTLIRLGADWQSKSWYEIESGGQSTRQEARAGKVVVMAETDPQVTPVDGPLLSPAEWTGIAGIILAAVVILLFSEIPQELPELAGLAEHEGKVVLILIGVWLAFVGTVQRRYSVCASGK